MDTSTLTFPAKFLVDYVRVYQPDGADSKVTCDPTGASLDRRLLVMLTNCRFPDSGLHQQTPTGLHGRIANDMGWGWLRRSDERISGRMLTLHLIVALFFPFRKTIQVT